MTEKQYRKGTIAKKRLRKEINETNDKEEEVREEPLNGLSKIDKLKRQAKGSDRRRKGRDKKQQIPFPCERNEDK